MPMRHYLGLAEYQYRKQGQNVPVHYEPERLINGHMLLCGMSGTGKSFQSMRFLASAADGGVEVDVLDVHDELDQIPGAKACTYSQATQYGFNPLELNTNPHTGGVLRQVNYLVGLMKELSKQLGAKQEACLRHLLLDTYAGKGIWVDNPRSWQKQRITAAKYRELTESRQWGELRNYYPTMEDLLSFAKRKLIAITVGGDNPSISALQKLRGEYQKLNKLQGNYAKASGDDELDKLQKQIAGSKEKAAGLYADFIEKQQTGREIDDVMKYDSSEVLTSVIQRIEVFNSAGIFNANPPPFGNARVRVHQIKSLTNEQQVLFVKLRLSAIFEHWKEQGATRSGTELRHVIFLDEGHKFFSKEPDDIVNVIAKEARKFGIGLWCASQSPTAFPEDFMTNVGATVLLGIHSSFWKPAETRMRVTEEQLKFIRSKQTMGIKLQRDGEADPPFRNVIVPNPNFPEGKVAAGYS
ncbi:MAG: hypothetical protein BWK73_09350 [Thiothrix lacustris]|uniref:Helicase HerA central domain-containing protein n=1 Tax=Thiothrix lacustris TaxID=525917 RepID=A0A1Y1QV40_9GAMM|nr:MAG: hypothetical protein BWK73_09350 [Thiothrix lacustris]